MHEPKPLDRDDPTLKSYGALIATYGAILTGATVTLARRGKLPERLAWSDLALAAAASNVLSRRITKDKVTRVVRAPFTDTDGPGAPGELNEHPRAERGFKRAIGELLACPFCLSQWTSTAVVLGTPLVFEPKEPGLMERPPRPVHTRLLDWRVASRVVLVQDYLPQDFTLYLYKHP